MKKYLVVLLFLISVSVVLGKDSTLVEFSSYDFKDEPEVVQQKTKVVREISFSPKTSEVAQKKKKKPSKKISKKQKSEKQRELTDRELFSLFALLVEAATSSN